MNIAKIVSTGAKATLNYVKSNPKTSAIVGGVGLLATVAVVSSANKPRTSTNLMNYLILTNPFINPFGFVSHMAHPENTDLLPIDSFLARNMVLKNNKNYEK